MYKLTNTFSILRVEDGALIPSDSTNSDYQTYLAWVAEGNTPISADIMTKTQAKEKIKLIRGEALKKFCINSGVLAVYDVNYEAALAYKENRLSTILRSGKTVEEHCSQFGSRMGMTASQYADYIISENRQILPNKKAGVLMAEIEDEYLRLYYSLIDISLDSELETIINNFKNFCNSRNP